MDAFGQYTDGAGAGFWQSTLSSAVTGIGQYFTNKTNQTANVNISANTSAAIASVVKFAVVIASVFTVFTFLVKLFKKR
jgi:hypothetical protein